jgi:DUF971 family protein
MSEGKAVMPIELRAPTGARTLEIDWSDGVTTRYPHRILRAFCPCAHCQGHQGPIRWNDQDPGDAALELTDIEEVGNYAVRLIWADGHGSGIFSFRFLRELGEVAERPLEELKAARFAR